MSVTELLRRSELFSGLAPEQIDQVATLCRKEAYDAGDNIIQEGEPTSEVYVIRKGMVEVLLPKGTIPDTPGPPQLTSLVHLGAGQCFGEMALVDRGVRSATVRCTKDETVLYVIPRDELLALCDRDPHIGYILMRNIASDLSFKLRHRNLQEKLER